ncbi:16S rRNA (cytosine(1402)-N(4))-methyltransferase [bacterium]|nr:16S rRNA (cytosine(1402)-N(4))-methyltransferase [bacterium]MBR4567029.1 16S rRNA (cytosine(1402)-N(4))-methyltransferase [bacterium]
MINKKVIVPHYTEVQKNKAARSAKLRIIEKL